MMMTKSLLNSENLSNEEEAPPYAFKVIRLNPGVNQTNFICSIIFMMITIFGFAAASNLQLLILLDPAYYNTPQDHIGTINSVVLAAQLIAKIVFVVPYGHLSDKIGRRKIVMVCATSFLVSCFLVPMQKSLFPGFILATVLSAKAGAAAQAVPLLADYIADESKGKAFAIVGLFAGFSAIGSSLFIKILFSLNLSLGACYYILGIFVFLALMANNLGLKKGVFHLTTRNRAVKPKSSEKPFLDNMKEALQVFKGNNLLQVSLVLQILGSSDFTVLISFVALFVKSLFPAGTPVIDQNTAINNVQIMITFPAIICNFVYGHLIDKKNLIILPCLFALNGGIASLILMSFSSSPTALTLYLGAILFGFTLPGLATISNIINLRNFPADKRGVMTGFSQVISNVTYFLIAGGGGLLFDNWRKDGPFFFCAGFLVIATFLVLMIYKKIKAEKSVPKISCNDSEASAKMEELQVTKTEV